MHVEATREKSEQSQTYYIVFDLLRMLVFAACSMAYTIAAPTVATSTTDQISLGRFDLQT